MERKKRKAESPYRNLTSMLLQADGLLAHAEAALLRVVAANPDDAATLLRLGEVQRGKGCLGEALARYRRVLALRPRDRTAAWLAALLEGTALPDAPPPTRPVPFVRQTDFLPAHRCEELLSLAEANRERFVPAPMGDYGQVDPSNRKALVERRIAERKVRPWLEPRLRDAFGEALLRLRLPEPPAYWVEMAMSAHLRGDFLAKHTDDAPPFRTRRLSYAYYFHRRPRRFAGGDLLLHDAHGAGFTRIEPQHNSIVFFPAAACVHQITAVAGDLDFRDARFAIHGWLRTGPVVQSAPDRERSR